MCLCLLCVCAWLRLLQGVGRPDEVLACVEAGVDLFEGFFPFQAAERGCALCFSFDITPDPERAGRAPLTGVVKRKKTLTLWWSKNIISLLSSPPFWAIIYLLQCWTVFFIILGINEYIVPSKSVPIPLSFPHFMDFHVYYRILCYRPEVLKTILKGPQNIFN